MFNRIYRAVTVQKHRRSGYVGCHTQAAEILELRCLLTSISNGQELFGDVAVGTSEEFDFDVSTGETVRISVGRIVGSGGVYLEVFDPTGQSIGVDTTSTANNGELQFTTSASGMYKALVREVDNDSAFSFRIRALILPGSSAPQLIANRDQVLSNGEEVDSSIPVGSFGLFPFDVSTGETVRISVGRIVGSGGVYLEVFDPTGQSIGVDTTSTANNGELQFTTSASGMYKALVREVDNDSAFSFRIRALILPGSSAPQLIANRDQVLSNGEEVDSSIPVGSFGLFPFDASAGETVRISVGQTGGGGGVYLEVFDSAGQSVGVDTTATANNGELQFSATINGTYTALVREVDNDTAFDFRIRALILPGSSAPQLIANRDQVLSNGEEVDSSIPVGSFGLFPFDASAGETVRISVGRTGGGGGVYLEVFDSAGQSVGVDTTATANNGELQFSATMNGTYTALVREVDNDTAFDFRIRALILPGSSAPQLIANRDQILSNGEEVDSSIPVGSFGLFPFDASAGETVRVSVGRTGGGGGVYLEVFDPTGQSVGVDTTATANNGELQFSATMNGTYTALVREVDNDTAFDFRIRALILPGSSAPQLIANRDQVLSNGEEVDSSIPVGSFGLFPFDASAGETVRISVGRTGGGGGVYLEVFDSAGQSVGVDTTATANNGELQFSATMNGTYTALVREVDNDTAFDFRIRALILPGSSAPQLIANRDQVLSNGEEVDSSIPVGSFSLFPFDTSTGEVARISVGQTGGSGGVYLEVFDPSGQSIGVDATSTANNGELQFLATATGTYTALVREFDNDSAFSFQIGFEAPAFAGLDIDRDGSANAATDGILAIRYLFGLRGDALIGGARGVASIATAEEVEADLDAATVMLDVDGSGTADAATDGILLLRFLFGLRNDALVDGALSSVATRTTGPEVATFLEEFLPSASPSESLVADQSLPSNMEAALSAGPLFESGAFGNSINEIQQITSLTEFVDNGHSASSEGYRTWADIISVN